MRRHLTHYLRTLLMLICLVATLAAFTGSAAAAAGTYDDQELEFLGLLNQYRAANSLPALVLSDQLSLSAEHHASDMSRYGFFSHQTVKSDYYPVGSHSWDRMRLDGYAGAGTSGENLAAGMAGAQDALRAWQNSPTHNANMLDPGTDGSRIRWRVIGIARVQNPTTGVWYWDTDFGGTLDPGDAAGRLVTLGIMDGYTDGLLGLGDPMLRQDFAKLILGSLGLVATESDQSPFPDVATSGAGSLYPDNFVALAYNRGIVKGMTDGRFHPWEEVSRAQVISMIVRALQAQAPGSLAVPPSDYRSAWGSFSSAHAGDSAIAEYNGLLAGLQLTQSSPWAPMPRGEVARVLSNMLLSR